MSEANIAGLRLGWLRPDIGRSQKIPAVDGGGEFCSGTGLPPARAQSSLARSCVPPRGMAAIRAPAARLLSSGKRSPRAEVCRVNPSRPLGEAFRSKLQLSRAERHRRQPWRSGWPARPEVAFIWKKGCKKMRPKLPTSVRRQRGRNRAPREVAAVAGGWRRTARSAIAVEVKGITTPRKESLTISRTRRCRYLKQTRPTAHRGHADRSRAADTPTDTNQATSRMDTRPKTKNRL